MKFKPISALAAILKNINSVKNHPVIIPATPGFNGQNKPKIKSVEEKQKWPPPQD
jgi:hypothetical protein